MYRLRTSLFWKLVLAFMLVVLVAVAGVALIARQTTASEFQRLRQGEGQSGTDEQIHRLADYYVEHGSWAGVSSLVNGGRGEGRGGRGGPPLRLADAGGQVILDTTGGMVGQRLSEEELAQGEPILAEGRPVGTLLVGGLSAVALNQADQDFLERVQKALLFSALAAIGIALILGLLLFRGITAPLRRLSRATAAVAAGDLTVQVPVQSRDELGQLGQAFNRMTNDLAQADRLRRDMMADIAHELRTPLTVIQGNLEAILDGVYPADVEHLEPVLLKTQLLKRLVEDLRTLALADAGELTLHRSRVNLGDLVRRAVKDFEARARADGVELTLAGSFASPNIPVDAPRVEQVLGILLDNALRHTPAGGQVRVSLREVGDEARVSVSDTGEGIPPQTLPHLFERFYRARSGGTGLGLAIAKAIVTAHGGHIWIESEVGQGTTVIFALPSTGGT